MRSGQQRRWQAGSGCLHSVQARSPVEGKPAVSIARPDIVGWTADLLRDEEGVTAIEYGLLAALIVVASLAAFGATGLALEALYIAWVTAVLDAL